MEIKCAVYQRPYEGMGVTTLLGNMVPEPLHDELYTEVFRGGIKVNVSEPQQMTPNGILEALFDIFNNQHPVGYMGHSLSTGDIVELCCDNGSKFYYCKSIEWVEVDFRPNKK